MRNSQPHVSQLHTTADVTNKKLVSPMILLLLPLLYWIIHVPCTTATTTQPCKQTAFLQHRHNQKQYSKHALALRLTSELWSATTLRWHLGPWKGVIRNASTTHVVQQLPTCLSSRGIDGHCARHENSHAKFPRPEVQTKTHTPLVLHKSTVKDGGRLQQTCVSTGDAPRCA
jgi:hypothetical protein